MELIKLLKTEKWKKLILQFFKFGIVGVINTLLTLSIIFILMRLFHVEYRIANGIGYVFGVINSFLWNKLWTFKSKNSYFREAVLFVLVFLVSYGIQFCFLVLFKEILHINVYIAQVISMVIYTIISFFGNRIFTFKS
jgi:putative flippase GtrA